MKVRPAPPGNGTTARAALPGSGFRPVTGHCLRLFRCSGYAVSESGTRPPFPR